MNSGAREVQVPSWLHQLFSLHRCPTNTVSSTCPSLAIFPQNLCLLQYTRCQGNGSTVRALASPGILGFILMLPSLSFATSRVCESFSPLQPHAAASFSTWVPGKLLADLAAATPPTPVCTLRYSKEIPPKHMSKPLRPLRIWLLPACPALFLPLPPGTLSSSRFTAPSSSMFAFLRLLKVPFSPSSPQQHLLSSPTSAITSSENRGVPSMGYHP